MIVVHMDCMHDTSLLNAMYEGLENTKVLYNPNREEVMAVLRANPNETLMCIGHGLSSGLYDKSWTGYVIDGPMAPLLQSREVIGIWCYAAEFARKYGLRGYFTNMFISNPMECICLGFDHTEEEIDYQNVKFSGEIRKLITNKVPLNKWVETLWEGCDHDIDFVDFNYDAMEYFDGTQKPSQEYFSHRTLAELNFLDNQWEDSDPDFTREEDTLFEPIETDRLILRQMTEDDAADILEICGDHETAYWAGMEPLKDIEDAKAYIDLGNFLEYEPHYGLTLKGSDKIIGEISVMIDPNSIGEARNILGYVMSKDYSGNGYMSEAVKAISDYLFKTSNVSLLMLEIRDDNLPSQGVARKCGFVKNSVQTTFRRNLYNKPLREYFLRKEDKNCKKDIEE